MRWYENLYVGEKAKKSRFSMIQGLREGKCPLSLYVITPASNGNNIIDIYPSPIFLTRQKKHPDELVLGIASGYWEALEVAAHIVDELFQLTGDFQLKNLPGIKL